MAVRILTDSAGDLPRDLLEQAGMDAVPLLVTTEGAEYRDGEDITPLDVMHRMRNGEAFKTAQSPPQFFLDKFESYAKNGDSCVYVGFSSQLSATYQSAVMARAEIMGKYPDFELVCIDTRCASIGQGLTALKAAELAKTGKEVKEIAEAIRIYATEMEHIFTVDDLEYLHRGGRVTRAAAMVGGILNIKPILHVDDGKLVPIEKIRGRNKAIKRMVEIMGERGKNLAAQTVGISHGDDLEGVEKLKEMIRLEYGVESFLVSNIGCVIGAHAGPGTLSVFFRNSAEG